MPRPLTDGALPIPAAPTRQMVPVVDRLRGHATARDWLPDSLDPAVDKIRERHLAQRERLVSAMTDLSGATVAFAEEDRVHGEALVDAQRAGKPVAADKRTPHVERGAVLLDLDAIFWAAAEVMAEVVTEAIDTLRVAEPRIFAALRGEAAESDDRIRRAQAEVTAAQQEHYRLLRLGQWIQATVDDGPFGTQPSPVVGPVPRNVSRESVRGALERPWHRQPSGAAA